jgi:hypothetical protein
MIALTLEGVNMKKFAAEVRSMLRIESVIFLGLFLGIASWDSSMRAQSGAGSVQGTVADSTGGVIPGALIHVVNAATNVAADTKSNGVGFFQVPDLFTGHYSVAVTAPGMKTYVTSLDLLVAQDAVINPVLTPGAITQEVVVRGNAVQLITPDDGTITATLENDRINQLPMNVRLLLGLSGETTPGVVLEGGTQPHVNGLTQEAGEYTIDGAPTSNDFYGGPQNQKVDTMDPDSVQEVRMETVSSGAQYAAPTTGVVTTKSGTNRIHGTFFETARNNFIGSAKNRQEGATYTAPHLVRNEFGANVGGPIVLPHVYHGQDKSFWFFAYERYSYATNSAGLYTVPTPAMSQGNFSGLLNDAGLLQTLYDPATTTHNAACPVPGGTTTTNNLYCRTTFTQEYNETGANVNSIPASEISPTAKIYYALLPQPTSAADPLVTTNLAIINPSFQVLPQETFRLDHVFNEENKAYVRFTYDIGNTNSSGAPTSLAADGIPAGAAEGHTNNPLGTIFAGGGYTHIFSPSFFAETIISESWEFNSTNPGTASGTDYEKILGLPNNFGEVGFPALGDATLLNNLTTSQSGNAKVSMLAFTADENLTKTINRNQLQFGFRFRHHRGDITPAGLADNITFGANPTGLYNTASTSSYTAVPNTGYADASMFIGSAGSYGVTQEPPHVNYMFQEFDGYLQDNYHLSKTLTLNVGLRYEAHPSPEWTKNNASNSFDLKNNAVVLAVPASTLISEGLTTQAIITNDQNIGINFETPAQAGMPGNTLMRSYDFNFLPRAGIAYQPFNGKYGTVVRAGYGRYAFFTPLTDFITGPSKNNPLVASYSQSYSTAAQSIDALPNELIRYNDPVQFGVMGSNTTNVVNSSTTNAILPGVSLYSDSPNWPPSFATETNFTVEQPLKGNSALRASWIWTHSTNLSYLYSYNNHPTSYEWQMATGTIPPTGTVIGSNQYSTTATGPYNQTTWGASTMNEEAGWSNYNSLQLNYQRLFHHGSAYQISYVQSHALRMGGDAGFTVDPYANYPGGLGTLGTMTSPYGTPFPGVRPPAPPSGLPAWADYHALDNYAGYMLDSSIPKQQINFNGVVDLPFGRGKRFLGKSNRFLDEVVGGFQLAGDGNIVSQVFAPSAGHWGPTSPIQIYKHKYPIVDCRSGVCLHSYMWYNGYLAPSVTQGVPGSTCTTNCVSGLPANYIPMQTPIDNTPGTTYYGTDDVVVTLANGKQTTIAYDAGPQGSNYLQKTFIDGPNNWTTDISVFKVFPITERMNLRFNVDAFNALNIQGWNNPGTGGVENNQSSYNTPRQIQLTGRFTF